MRGLSGLLFETTAGDCAGKFWRAYRNRQTVVRFTSLSSSTRVTGTS